MRKNMLRGTLWTFVLLALMVAAAPVQADAEKSLFVWPGDLEPVNLTQDATQFPGWLQSNSPAGGPAAVFSLTLDLPRGATLRELTLVYSAAAVPTPLYGADIWRVSFGGAPEQIMSVGATASTGGKFVSLAELTATEAISGNPADLVIQDDALYYLEVATVNVSSVIHGVRVFYRK